MEGALELSAGLLLGLLIESLGLRGLEVFPLLFNLFLLFLLFLPKLQLEISLMKDITEHQLRIECLDLVKSGILLLDSFLKDLITLLSLNLELRLVQSPLMHFLFF